MWADFDAFCRDHGDAGADVGPLGPDFIAESPWLNLYLYPAEADYAARAAARPDLAPARLDASGRPTATWTCPSTSRARDGGARSTCRSGSLGSADVGLMQRLVDILGRTRPPA